MSSKTDICNMALIHLGVDKQISDVDTDSSSEAKITRRVWDMVFPKFLRGFEFPNTTKELALGLVETLSSTEEWDYSYRYPSDCLMFRRIKSGTRNETSTSEIPYRIIYDDGGSPLIYTDEADAVGVWTINITDPEDLTEDQALAFSCLLAAYSAAPLTAGDPYGLGKKAMEMYLYESENAAKSAYNEVKPEAETPSEFERMRNT